MNHQCSSNNALRSLEIEGRGLQTPNGNGGFDETDRVSRRANPYSREQIAGKERADERPQQNASDHEDSGVRFSHLRLLGSTRGRVDLEDRGGELASGGHLEHLGAVGSVFVDDAVGCCPQ
jgi:hypothetical protein